VVEPVKPVIVEPPKPVIVEPVKPVIGEPEKPIIVEPKPPVKPVIVEPEQPIVEPIKSPTEIKDPHIVPIGPEIPVNPTFTPIPEFPISNITGPGPMIIDAPSKPFVPDSLVYTEGEKVCF
jgi:hypothetical protein